MAENGNDELSDSDKQLFQWISGPYFSGVCALLDSNRNYLNQGITWSIGILTAVLIFVLTYIAPLQEVKDASGTVTSRSFAAVLHNITETDILLLAGILSLAFAFVANFMSRSIKGYLNLLRYASLYSRCVRLASGSTPVTASAIAELSRHIKQYDDDFCPPLTLRTVVAKMMTELGYGLFVAILILADAAAVTLWYLTATTIGFWIFWVVIALGPAWLVAELVLLRRSSYFRYGSYPTESWSEALSRR